MGNLLGSIEVGAKALMAQLAGMRVAGHNIANANTEGYTRQQVLLESSRPDVSPFGPVGSGVESKGIRRIRDAFIESQLRSETEVLERWNKKHEILSRIELVLGEPSDDGLAAAMTEFWNRWRDLAGNPEEHGLRVSVVEQGRTLANTFQRIYSDLERVREELNGSISLAVTEVNTYLRQISGLNEQIRNVEMDGGTANDLRDQRQVLLQKLSGVIDVQIVDPEAAELKLISHGQVCVDGPRYMQLSAVRNNDTGMTDVVWAGTGTALQVEGGTMLSLVEGRDEVVVSYMDQLSQLAREMILAVNRVHCSGRGLVDYTSLTSLQAVDDVTAALSNTDETGLAFAVRSGSFQLVVTDSSGRSQTYTIPVLDGQVQSLQDVAARIDGADVPHLSASVDGGKLTITADDGYTFAFANDTSDLLAAMGMNTFFTGSAADDIGVASSVTDDPRLVAAGLSGEPGDGDNARAIAQLEDAPTMNSGMSSLRDFYRDMVVSLGVSVQEADRFASGQQQVVDRLRDRRESISGVSVDEETADIVKYQRAYQAAAQFISAVDEMIDFMLRRLA